MEGLPCRVESSLARSLGQLCSPGCLNSVILDCYGSQQLPYTYLPFAQVQLLEGALLVW